MTAWQHATGRGVVRQELSQVSWECSWVSSCLVVQVHRGKAEQGEEHHQREEAVDAVQPPAAGK